MSTFLTRVELHDAVYQDYTRLHEYMRQEGFTTSIQGDDGYAYHLPPAEYHLTAPWTASQAREAAARAARKTGKSFGVISAEYTSASWQGLSQVQMARA